MQFTKSTLAQNVMKAAVLTAVLFLAFGAFASDFMPNTLKKPTVSFTGAPASAPDKSSFTVAATTNDGTTATITATGSCSISGDTVTMTKTSGTCAMTATWPATATYASAKATQKTIATIDWAESVIYPFGSQNDPDAESPSCNGTIMDTAGNIYGTSVNGLNEAQNEDGTFFELSPVEGGGWNETILYSFNRLSTGYNGYHPCGTITKDSKGHFYGTTISGGNLSVCLDSSGNTGCGTVYELSKNATTGAWTATGLYSFQGAGIEGSGTTDGYWPVAGVTLATSAATTLYGTTTCGGTGMIKNMGDLCGDLSGGGKNANGAGTVYKLVYTKPTGTNKGGWTETVLYNFEGNAGADSGADGWLPQSGLLLKSGNLYGTTVNGGAFHAGTSGAGVVYELQPTGTSWTESVLYSFCAQANCADGGNPVHGTPAMDTAGNLYGTASVGGSFGLVANSGVAWELVYSSTAQTYTEKVLYSFGTNPNDGFSPEWGIVPYKSGWYGVNNPCVGEFSCTGSSGGTAFELTYSATTGWQETILHQFTGNSTSSSDVYQPGVNQLIVDTKGNLFGMGEFGPEDGLNGGVFEISPK